MEKKFQGHSTTMNWKNNLKEIQNGDVLNPYQGKLESLKSLLIYALENENKMHPNENSIFATVPYVKQFLESDPGQDTPDYSQTNKVVLPDEGRPAETVIDKVLSHIFNTMHNPMHPNFQFNVIPHSTNVAIVSSLIGMLLNPNIVNSHLSYNAAKTELELSSFIAHLLPLGNVDGSPSTGLWPPPWAPESPKGDIISVGSIPAPCTGSGGISTFGGTGCYLYGIKYALTKVANSVLKDKDIVGRGSRFTGFPQGKFVFMTSNQGHYCYSNVSDWTGIGIDNVIKVKTTPKNTMCLEDLELKLMEAKRKGKVVIAVVPTIGTTDATAIDDVKGIRKIIDNFDNIDDYRKPMIYVDAVAGWSWLLFAKYDLESNPEGYDKELLAKIMENAVLAQNISYADMFGIDFHKTGYCHYTSSMIMIRDYGDFATTMQRPSSAYLQQEQYDVGLYSLEATRGCIGTISPWATLNYLGQSGMRTILYNLVHNQEIFRKKLQQTKFIAICNNDAVSYATLFRVYPFYPEDEEEDVQKYFEKELTDKSLKYSYMRVNSFQKKIYSELYERLRKPKRDDETNLDLIYLKVPNLGLSTGYREVYYDIGSEDNGNCDTLDLDQYKDVHVLKSYTKTVFTNENTMNDVIEVISHIRNNIYKNMKRKSREAIFKEQNEIIPGIVPEGINRQNNLIPPKFIPIRFLESLENGKL